jgi:hypothetical protein
MTSRRRAPDDKDEGYILAAALATLFAMSVVAIALVTISQDALRGVRAAEIRAANDQTLRSAILVAESQLLLDPRRRQLDLDQTAPVALIEGRQVSLAIKWEAAKLDVNLAAPEAIDAALSEAGLPVETRNSILNRVRDRQAKREPVSLLDDISSSSRYADCLASVLTVFGGRREAIDKSTPTLAAIGLPAPGSRLLIEASLVDAPQRSRAAVILLTGNPHQPAKILDWREPRGSKKEAPCHDQ